MGGDPADLDAAVRRNHDALRRGRMPRLLLHGEPGSVVGTIEVDWCRRDGAGLEIVSVGAGTHFLPEDQPEAISRALTAWLSTLRGVVALEGAVPLLTVAVVAIGTGFGAAAMYATEAQNRPMVAPGLAYYLLTVGGIIVSLAIIAATFPILTRITGPEVARND